MADAVRFPNLVSPLLATLLAAAPAHAQIVTDGTLGPKVSLSGSTVDIGAQLGTQRGDNLFHSFEKFGIAAGQTATFTGPDTVKNVISRVTGERSPPLTARWPPGSGRRTSTSSTRPASCSDRTPSLTCRARCMSAPHMNCASPTAPASRPWIKLAAA